MFKLTNAQRDLQERARALARGEIAQRAAEVDRTEEYPWQNVEALKRAGFFGMTIPQEYGGQGLGFVEAVLLIDEMAQVCGVTGRISVEANMGAISAIMRYGTEDQKRLAAELVLSGDKPAICITEPDAGSAASEMTTRADLRGDRYVINGQKHWITGGGDSKLNLIFARVHEDDEPKGIGGFIYVRDGSTGFEVGRRSYAMGLRGIPERELIFKDLEVPADRLLLPPEGLRRGFARLMDAYNSQRVGAGTVALGLARGAYQLALEYSQHREQFGRPICEFQGLQWMLADMSVQISAAEALLFKAAESNPDGFPDSRAAAEAKLFAAEMAIDVTNNALQIFGAAGYGRDLPLERMVRDARMFTIGGGTAQILRTLIASRVLNRKLPQNPSARQMAAQ